MLFEQMAAANCSKALAKDLAGAGGGGKAAPASPIRKGPQPQCRGCLKSARSATQSALEA